MSGGLMRLVAYGAQNMYLVGEHRIDFNKPNIFTRPKTTIFLSVIDFTAELENESCPICLDNYKSTDQIHKTICEHLFHHDCMYEYISQNYNTTYKCPNCRCQINKIFI